MGEPEGVETGMILGRGSSEGRGPEKTRNIFSPKVARHHSSSSLTLFFLLLVPSSTLLFLAVFFLLAGTSFLTAASFSLLSASFFLLSGSLRRDTYQLRYLVGSVGQSLAVKTAPFAPLPYKVGLGPVGPLWSLYRGGAILPSPLRSRRSSCRARGSTVVFDLVLARAQVCAFSVHLLGVEDPGEYWRPHDPGHLSPHSLTARCWQLQPFVGGLEGV